jgi:hypothetical protein
MEEPVASPPQFDLYKPSASRVYDYLLGGSHNFEVDRDVARQMLRLAPEAAQAAQANRSFLGRAVRYLTERGIRQFLDIGSGIPTVGNVHEIAQKFAPDSRVVYVDIDPVAVLHSQHILAGDPRCAVIRGDLREPGEVLADPQIQDLIDFDKPVALLLVAVLHFLDDDQDPGGLVAKLRDEMVPGSPLVISHAGWPADTTQAVMQARHAYDRTETPFMLRRPDEIAGFFDGYDLVDPGLVTVARWRAEPDVAGVPAARTDRLPAYAGVGIKSALPPIDVR